jgi:hypothetical protein
MLPNTNYTFSVWIKTENASNGTKPGMYGNEYRSDGSKICQHKLRALFPNSDWTRYSITFTTDANIDYFYVYTEIYYGNGAAWFDDTSLVIEGSDENLIKDGGFEDNARGDKTNPAFDGVYLDSVGAGETWICHKWADLENYRRYHWQYTDHPLVFSYSSSEPVLLGMFSMCEYIDFISKDMHDKNKFVMANIFGGYDKYAYALDMSGSEIWALESDEQSSYRRTLSYHKPISNLLSNPNDIDTHEEMETYINSELFYGIFPSVAQVGTTYFWNHSVYENYRDLYKKYIPIIKTISAAGWEPIPYSTCDNPNIEFERYGSLSEGLYYTTTNINSTTEGSVLSVDLSKLGFDGTHAEVKELVTNTTPMQSIEYGKVLITIPELHPNDVLVYKISL